MRPENVVLKTMAAGENVLYRGEGIRNLVLTNIEEKQVYRLQKIVQKHNTDNFIDGKHSEEERSLHIHQNLQGVVNYINNVMRPLLSSSFVSVPNLKQIPKGFVEKVESEIEHLRPVYRKIHDEDFRTIDPATCSALVLPDLCFVTESSQQNNTTTISVEIKPKKGFLPSLETLGKQNAIKANVCHFCLHKRLKEKEGRWSNSSQYCPVDLFSGDRRRMKHALLSLYDTPQNNFKMFKDGSEVFSETVKEDISELLHSFFKESVNGLKNGVQKYHELHTFLDLIVDALLFVPEQKKTVQTCHNESKQMSNHCDCVHANGKDENLDFCLKSHTTKVCANSSYRKCDMFENDDSVQCLPPESVLGRILCTQQLDDSSDIDGVYPLYEKVKEHLKVHPQDRVKFGVYGPFTRESWLQPCISTPGTDDKDSLEYAVYKIKRFIVSKTMQDCSIMVAMQRCLACSQNKECDVSQRLSDNHGGKFHFSVNIIDLDPKPFGKLIKYRQLEKNILQAYNEQCA